MFAGLVYLEVHPTLITCTELLTEKHPLNYVENGRLAYLKIRQNLLILQILLGKLTCMYWCLIMYCNEFVAIVSNLVQDFAVHDAIYVVSKKHKAFQS